MKLILLTFLIISFSSPKKSLAEDTLSPPQTNGPVKIYLSLFINNINEISAANHIMKADIFLVAKWKDSRLAHKDGRKIFKSLTEIWDPLLTISNRLNITKSLPENASILSDGTVIYMQRIYGDFMQDFQLKDFPMDVQTFIIRLIAIGYTSDEIELEADPDVKSGISDDLDLQDWEILDWKYDKTPYSFIKEENKLPAFTFSFRAKRESGFYILIYVVPLILIIMMSWTVFWLDPKLSATQIAVATTSMLTLIAYRFVVIGNLPKISYLTRMDFFVLASSVLIFLTLVQAILNAAIVDKGKDVLARRIDLHSRWVFPLLYLIVYFIAFVF